MLIKNHIYKYQLYILPQLIRLPKKWSKQVQCPKLRTNKYLYLLNQKDRNQQVYFLRMKANEQNKLMSYDKEVLLNGKYLNRAN